MNYAVNVIGAEINMNEGIANPPTVTILIEGTFPKVEDMRGWISKTAPWSSGDMTAWWCTDDAGLVMFFLQTNDMAGYGGREIKLTLPRGEIQVLKGPWSSRPGVMNALGFPHSVSVAIKDKTGARYSGAFLLHPLISIIEEYLPDIGIYRVVDDTEPSYGFGRRDEGPREGSWDHNKEYAWV